MIKNFPLSLSLWVWVGVIFVAYLYQFRDLALPILKVLGTTLSILGSS